MKKEPRKIPLSDFTSKRKEPKKIPLTSNTECKLYDDFGYLTSIKINTENKNENHRQGNQA